MRALCCLLSSIIFLSGLLYLPVLAQKPDPEMSITRFKNLPIELAYFDDSSVVTYYDAMEEDVWISQDEGKSWELIPDIPRHQSAMIIMHPYDRNVAFILTKDTTHYRTDDRGKTWRPFQVPAPPALINEPITFHYDNMRYMIYQGVVCKSDGWWGANKCHQAAYYTLNGFDDKPKLLLEPTRECRFAHSSKDFKHSAHRDLVFCVAWERDAAEDSRSSKLFASTDFFTQDRRVVALPGGNRNADGVVALAIVSKFAVAAVRDLTAGSDEMFLFVSVNAEDWAKAKFPRASSSKLRENAYTIVESTTHSLAVDVLLHPKSAIGTLFVSNSNGTYFVQSLQNTNRNVMGFVDYETIYGVEGVGLANIVENAVEVEGRGSERIITSMATFDDGSSWAPIKAPAKDSAGNDIGCDTTTPGKCSLHLHSVTSPHNLGRIFSSPAPGFVIGVGSVGDRLLPYGQCDTFMSTDAGVTWTMIHKNAYKYEFGDQGSIMVIVDDEEYTDSILYSYDSGNTWHDFNIGVKVRARVLTTIPDSTSQKFLLIGTLHKTEIGSDKLQHASIFLDFVSVRKNKCQGGQFEKWYARTSKGKECVMGHKQWYERKKPDADCYVGDKFKDPVEYEEDCPCDDDDYECDFNYVRAEDKCEPQGPERIPAGVCTDAKPGDTYLGSSGYRLIPGNTCKGGLHKDEPIHKDCSKAELPPGEVAHQTFEFPSSLVQQEYFRESETILVRLRDGTMWQSRNEGYTWSQLFPNERFVAFRMHQYAYDRAYLITTTNTIYGTVDTGSTWTQIKVDSPANPLGIPPMSFHPTQSDWIIWVGGTTGCQDYLSDCRTDAYYTTNNGGGWHHIESYIKGCAWARDTDLKIDRELVLCQSYREKKGNQLLFGPENPVELWEGSHFYSAGSKRKLFDNVVGFTKFSEYLIVAELQLEKHSLDLQVSLDGSNFATGLFPPSLRPDNHAYTVLESSTDSVFLHLTTSDRRGAEFGHLLKSNSNGTFYGVSLEHVNRNEHGYVDFEKMIGLDGIALVNVVSNTDEVLLSGHKDLQTRITHNDGGSWKPLVPPKQDSNNQPYPCSSAGCALHIHGYTERYDPRATYSTPSVPGLLMAVGNVGDRLASYRDSDTFLSRDAGFTWEEVHKDAHLWEFGDSGSILVMANDEEPTDHVLFSTDEGLHWNEYNFGERMRVQVIVTVPSDTSRRFTLFGVFPSAPGAAVAVHLDFSSLTSRQCVLDVHNSEQDDFELWSPSEQREERCLFGRQTLYHRRIRDRNCYVGKQVKKENVLVQNCTCTDSDFECEFNHVRNADGQCVLEQGLSPLPNDDHVCWLGEEDWYERTAYRKIPYSTCEGGPRPDHGLKHACPGPKAYGWFFWLVVTMIPFGFCGLVGWWYTKKSGLARGTIRLPERYTFDTDSGILATLASVPFFLVGLAGIAWEYVASRMPTLRSRRGYRNVPIVDEDAQVLRFEDDE